jgi:hypothetical protein
MKASRVGRMNFYLIAMFKSYLKTGQRVPILTYNV